MLNNAAPQSKSQASPPHPLANPTLSFAQTVSIPSMALLPLVLLPPTLLLLLLRILRAGPWKHGHRLQML